ncbi:MAG TPA: serine/threonine-protein kinase [Gemmatimonadales bacterium]|jgi:serine/threonine-protein kinase|nr:serine/threonine-protein kinase [Gemmatimonadales bacterium]
MQDLRPQLEAALAGRFRFERELGGGGMSRVYLAEEVGLARKVVVKVLAPELSAGVNADRFRRETQLAASLQHPHIVPLLAAGTAGDLLYFTMPFVEGESLRARVKREGALPLRDAGRILHDVADALAYAHARGVVHRDIKPDNVLLSGNHALVADFGIAKAISSSGGSSGLTSVGVAIGTPAYMAPEQAAGDPTVDHRADIYSFGAMAYEALSGHQLFEGLSPQQTLAAHLTEPPEHIAKKRPQVPPELADLVMACLEKNAADRPQTADEVLRVLEGTATLTSGGTRHTRTRTGSVAPLKPRTRWIVSAVAALAGIGLVWGIVGRSGGSPLDDDKVAVAPFDVLDPSLQLWREGLVDILARSLDGAGPLRTVSPTLVVKRWMGRADPIAARQLGQNTGARIVVYGALLNSGPDSVRLSANVLDVSTGAQLGAVDLRDHKDRIDRLADSVAVHVLQAIGATRIRGLGLARATGIGSASLPAVRAFLTGEQFLRHSEWDSALVAYQQAFGIDSGFTLAYAHAGLAAGWGRSGGDSLTTRYQLRAGALNHGLAPRDSFLVQSESLMTMVFEGPQTLAGKWWTYGKRAVATLEEAVRRYPDDPELWYSLGDARFHAGMLAGESSRQSLDAFDRAIELDSTFSPAYVHPMQLGSALDGPAGGLRYAAAYLRAGGGGRYAGEAQSIGQLLDPGTNRARRNHLADSLAGGPGGKSMLMGPELTAALRTLNDSSEVDVRYAQAMGGVMLKNARSAGDSFFARSQAAVALGNRGHFRAALDGGGNLIPQLAIEYLMLGAVPADSADRAISTYSRHLVNGNWSAMAWWAGRGDTASIKSFVQYVDSVRRKPPPPPKWPQVAVELTGYLMKSGPAYLALARRDTTAALGLFEALPDTACFGVCPLDHLVRIELLAARGRDQEAARRLDEEPAFNHRDPLPSDVLWSLEKGRVNERLKNTDVARDAYADVVAHWAHGDPALRPFVDEARAALGRLSREKQ